MDSFDGAVLICDITGFTQLTEQLSKQGPSGVEQLTKCMNNYFTKVSTSCVTPSVLLAPWPKTAHINSNKLIASCIRLISVLIPVL